MPDIRIIQYKDFPRYAIGLDWSLLPTGELDDRESLATAVIVALSTDALAAKSDVLPDPRSKDRKGWWGDYDAEEVWNGWPIGSRLWLLRRVAITDVGSREGATLGRVENYLRQCLMPFKTGRIVTDFTMEVERNAYN